ncbi:hypothetical protein [Acinetobacter sp. WZC-1]|uniref:hypothetical protein n=1 Tax=Acinetobacter sp. WZC-1 TaxID=3459034 RepID=UPI00403DEA19
MKIVSIAAAMLTATALYAQTPTETKTPPPYGDNPNIFKVIGYKTQQTVENTAGKIGKAAEKGVDATVKKVNQAKDAIVGNSGGVPIEQKQLSQSSAETTATAPVVATTPVTDDNRQVVTSETVATTGNTAQQNPGTDPQTAVQPATGADQNASDSEHTGSDEGIPR